MRPYLQRGEAGLRLRYAGSILAAQKQQTQPRTKFEAIASILKHSFVLIVTTSNVSHVNIVPKRPPKAPAEEPVK